MGFSFLGLFCMMQNEICKSVINTSFLVKNLLAVGQMNYHNVAPEFEPIFYHVFFFSLLTGVVLQFFWELQHR